MEKRPRPHLLLPLSSATYSTYYYYYYYSTYYYDYSTYCSYSREPGLIQACGLAQYLPPPLRRAVSRSRSRPGATAASSTCSPR